jgi:hypothetical protein
MIRHASSAQPVGALAQTMTESPSLRLLVPTVGDVSLLVARLLSAGGTAVALPTVTAAADPKERAASSCATESHSENDFGHRVSLRMTQDVTLHEIEDVMRACGADDDISFSTFSGESSENYGFR